MLVQIENAIVKIRNTHVRSIGGADRLRRSGTMLWERS